MNKFNLKNQILLMIISTIMFLYGFYLILHLILLNYSMHYNLNDFLFTLNNKYYQFLIIVSILMNYIDLKNRIISKYYLIK